MGKKMCEVGGVDLTEWWIGMEGLRPSGPGSVGQVKLTFDKEAGGLDIKNKQLVKVWQAFDDAGTGVAPNGRYHVGILDQKLTKSISNSKLWECTSVDCNILLKILQVDINDPAAVVDIPAGNLATQVLELVETVQGRGFGPPAVVIDAITHVNNLATGLPAYTAHGKTLGQMLLELCQNARVIDPALRPLFYIGVDITTFGTGELVGGPVLHLWDSALLPSPLYTFSDTPTGAQRYRYGEVLRRLDSTKLYTRGQATYGTEGGVATYALDAAAEAYPNQFINHLLGHTSNEGHWQAPLVKDPKSLTEAEAEEVLSHQILATAWPREIYQHGCDVVVLPGQVVTEIDSLEDGLSGGVDYGVVASQIDVAKDVVAVECQITLGSRRLELLELPEGALAAPAEGDDGIPMAPSNLVLVSMAWDYSRYQWLATFTWGNSVSRDVDRHTLWNGLNGYPVHLEGEALIYMDPGEAYSAYVLAHDTSGHTSGPSNVEAGTAPPMPDVQPADNLAVASNVYNAGTDLADITYTWTASPDPGVSGYKLTQVEGGVTRSYILGLVTTAVISLIAGTTVADARIYAFDGNRVGFSVAEPSEAGLADFTAAKPVSYGWPRVNPGFEAIDPNDPTLPARWSRVVTGTGTAVRSTTNPLTDLAAARCSSGASGSALMASALIKVLPSRTYRLGVWVYVSVANTDNLKLYLNQYNRAQTYLTNVGDSDFTIIPANTWYFFSHPLSLGSSTAYVSIRLGNNGNTANVVMDFDDVYFELLATDQDVQNQALTGASLAPLAIATGHIQDASVTAAKLASDSVTTAKITDANVTAAKLATDSVTTAKILDDAVTLPKISHAAAQTKTATFTADATTDTYRCNSASAITANLPAASGLVGFVYTFKNINSGAVTIDADGSDTIEGIGTFPLIEKGQSVTLKAHSTGWDIVSQAGLVLESDGTRWLGIAEDAPLGQLWDSGAPPYTVHDKIITHFPYRTTDNLYFLAFYGSIVNTGTNNSSNYWTVEMQKGDGTLLASINSLTGYAGGYDDLAEATTFSANPVTGTKGLIFVVKKTGAPGGLIPSLGLRYRRVYS